MMKFGQLRHRWGASLQRFSRLPSWNKGGLLLREGDGVWRGKGGEGDEGRGGKM